MDGKNYYTEIYDGKLLRISYIADTSRRHERLCTAKIIKEDEDTIIVHTIKDEFLTIRKDLINSIRTKNNYEKHGQQNGQQC